MGNVNKHRVMLVEVSNHGFYIIKKMKYIKEKDIKIHIKLKKNDIQLQKKTKILSKKVKKIVIKVPINTTHIYIYIYMRNVNKH